MQNPDVDIYISRSKLWPEEMAALRPVLLGAGLGEAIKWGKPCYSHGNANVAIVQEMKDSLALMFFKGALLGDPDGILEDQGPNSRAAKRVVFRSVDDVQRLADVVGRYLAEAVAVEEAGLEVPPAPEAELCAELAEQLARDPELAAAFDALTPGRQREYNLHISEAKQSATRTARAEKHVERIKAGKGLRDR